MMKLLSSKSATTTAAAPLASWQTLFGVLMLVWLLVAGRPEISASAFTATSSSLLVRSTTTQQHDHTMRQPPLMTGLAAAAKKSKKGFGSSTKQQPALDTTDEATISPPKRRQKQKQESSELNAGQRALAEMRRQKAEEKDEELRKVRELLETDEQLQQTPATIPEPVAQRMGKRMLPFVGIPLFLGMGCFVTFWYLATYKNLEFQPALVAGSTILILVLGLLGITYSVMSASWDPDREGTFLGSEEFQRNIANIKDGMGRSRENAILRDKMSGLSEDELQKSLQDLERREAAESKKQQSLSSKFKDELD